MDGAGKSTQIRKLKEYFEDKDYQVILTREPGGTDIGEKIRQLILDPENIRMTAAATHTLTAALKTALNGDTLSFLMFAGIRISGRMIVTVNIIKRYIVPPFIRTVHYTILHGHMTVFLSDTPSLLPFPGFPGLGDGSRLQDLRLPSISL